MDGTQAKKKLPVIGAGEAGEKYWIPRSVMLEIMLDAIIDHNTNTSFTGNAPICVNFRKRSSQSVVWMDQERTKRG